jgi:hypothetical protein
MTFLYLYKKVFVKSNYKKDMNMGDLYIKYRVENYRREYTTSITKEIEDTFEKLHHKYVIGRKISPMSSDYYEM